MKSAGFVHLHNHSEYSVLDGMLRITDGEGHASEFLKELAEKKVPALAITDHGNMYGAMEFYFTASSLGIKPVIGCELYVARDSIKQKSGTRRDNGHITILAENYEGYLNLIQLVSRAFLEGFYHDPRIDKELLSRYGKGLIVLSGCLKSHIARLCADGSVEEAVKLAGEYGEILGKGNFYIELMNHGLPEEQAALKNLVEVSKKTSIPVVATNDCHYQKKDDYEAHDVHICISTNSLVEDADRMRMNTNELYFKSPEEMIALFSDVPDAVKNTLEIAQRCNVKIETGKLYLPHFNVPPPYKGPDAYLKVLCESGLGKKMGAVSQEYAGRLAYELSVIENMGFASYFLIVSDFINYAKSNGIPVGPGRGSGAGSLVAYSLGITMVDPIKHGLLFERFLNPDRKTMPDLDIDFSDEGRDKVIEYVRNKYGKDNVANIITYGTIKAKSAVRDVGRVMNVPLAQVNTIAKLIPANATLYQAFSTVPQMKEMCQDPKIKKLFDIALKIEGLRRHTGVHAAGVVITREPVSGYAPLSNRNTKEVVTTQYDGNMLTRLGLLKVDFLGLRTLTVIETGCGFIKEKNKKFDIYEIPTDDEKTFKLLCSGHTTGVFQLESEGMKELIRSLKPSNFNDISALVALYRPGPIQSKMLELFVERKHGRKKIVYEHPLLEPVLKDTYGTIVYQEQVMEIAKSMGGCSPGQADSLRKAMSKKNPEEMEKFREIFISGAKKNDITGKLAAKIFDQMLQFALYGFNKSHSVAYALLAYQTAYLKANYPLEFMSALLTSEIGHSPVDVQDKENKLVTYVEEAQEMGIKVLPPDVNFSKTYFSIEDFNGEKALRFALNAVKNVGEGVVELIVQEREKSGVFKSTAQLSGRMDIRQLNKRVMESLAKAGALDDLYPEGIKEEKRSKAILEVEAMFNGSSKKTDINQELLFGVPGERDGNGSDGCNAERLLNEHTILKYEKEVLGFYLSGHPLASCSRYTQMINNATVEKIFKKEIPAGSKVRIAGILLYVKNTRTKKGEQMARFEIEDLTGSIQVCMFPETYSRYSSGLVQNQIIVVSGTVKASNLDREALELVAEEVHGLYEAISRWGRHLVISFSDGVLLDENQLTALKHVLSKHAGSCPVYFRLNTRGSGKYLIETSIKTGLSENLFKEIETTLGEKTWQVESAY
ncbi:MAG: DNA polymerase III subunit alpha [Elusimicrobia bacterium]|nr:DNA polymerase III subunit alpha [Elusimicrobiota bacterium]